MSRIAQNLSDCSHSLTHSASLCAHTTSGTSASTSMGLWQRLNLRMCYSMRTLFALCGMTLVLTIIMLWLNPVQAKENVIETSYFTAHLGTSWQTTGVVHNNQHSVNINFVNRSAQSTLNVVVGSGKIQPYALLVDLQKALRQQGANVGPIHQNKALLYFEFNLNGLGGYACSATNGQDVSSITILGNPQAGLNFVRQFTNRNLELFPDL